MALDLAGRQAGGWRGQSKGEVEAGGNCLARGGRRAGGGRGKEGGKARAEQTRVGLDNELAWLVSLIKVTGRKACWARLCPAHNPARKG
jgi:hypothetical protein